MKKLFRFIIILILIVLFLYAQNNYLQTSFYKFKSDKVNGNLRIIQISDTHDKKFVFDNYFLIKKLRKLKPDIIIHTGDVVTSGGDHENSYLLMRQLVEICPVYFIQGNHDTFDVDYNELSDNLKEIGVIVLDNDYVYIQNNIRLIGFVNSFNEASKYLEANPVNTNYYNICLIHKPNSFELLENSDFDLFLSGHTHGGQWRIPFVGGLIAPNKELFPGKNYGYKVYNNTEGIINRGLGGPKNSLRLNNFPEITVLDVSSLDRL